MKIFLKPFLLAIGIGLSLFFFSCVDSKKSAELADTIDEGVIEYSIVWPKSFMDAGFSFILPKKATMWFTPENQRYAANGAMDLFSLQLIKSSENDTLFTLFEAISQKIYTFTIPNQELSWMRMKEDWRIVIIEDSTKLIHNLECAKALLFEPNAIGPSATVWFTKRISAKKLYSNTFLEQIPGVIMEVTGNFNTHYFTIRANSIVEKEIPANWFLTPPAGYQLVRKEEIEERLKNIFN
ncbi:MAG TPA: hypothetical protein VJ855_02525 [Marinilabiliaceae bacterium]|nr:hypothetical protein [Marinilabiliaceae bacterium]